MIITKYKHISGDAYMFLRIIYARKYAAITQGRADTALCSVASYIYSI